MFKEDAEVTLYNAYEKVINATYSDYKEELEALFGLKRELDGYFDDVMVNTEDEALKINRLHTIGSVYKTFRNIADIKEIYGLDIMSKTYDTIIIGAGIAGAATAHALTQKGQKVLVVDKRGIASGGSGAAGAFVSPKIGKGSSLQTLTNEAFSFAKDFYLSTCPEYFHQTGVIRIPKDEAGCSEVF